MSTQSIQLLVAQTDDFSGNERTMSIFHGRDISTSSSLASLVVIDEALRVPDRSWTSDQLPDPSLDFTYGFTCLLFSTQRDALCGLVISRRGDCSGKSDVGVALPQRNLLAVRYLVGGVYERSRGYDSQTSQPQE
jgi:hypothetical protein